MAVSPPPRPAKLAECPRCATPILTGRDDHGLDVTAVAACLTRHGEIQAAIAGLACWRIDTERRMWRTDRWRITADAPMPGDSRITTHRCDQPLPASWLAPIPTAATTATEEPMF